MPSEVKDNIKKSDSLVEFEVLLNGCRYIKVPVNQIENYIQWSYKHSKYLSKDKKYKVTYSEDSRKYVVYERVGGAKSEMLSDFVDYKLIRKEFCTECCQLHDKEDIIYVSQRRKRSVCKNCIKILVPCNTCKTLILPDDLLYYLDKGYCKKCTEKYLRKCMHCGNYFDKEDKGLRVQNGMHYCSNCVPLMFKICMGCHQEFFIENLRQHRRGLYCQSCLENVVVIKEYNFTPENFISHKLEWDNKLCLGLEVEIETNRPRADDEIWASETLKFLKKLGLENLFYIKHDGTIEGFELVSHPATLQYLHAKVPWFEILKWCREKGFTSYKSGNCGLHVHLSKEFFELVDVHKLRLFFATNKMFIYKFSKRFGYNDKYCQYEEVSPSDFIKDGKRQDGKYWAIRTRPGKKNTVELRVFRGTLSYPRFLASLQFCDALAHYIKMVSIVSCQKKSSWVSFIQWCTKTNAYQHFTNYIRNNEELNKTEV